jgi:hypothetical protein
MKKLPDGELLERKLWLSVATPLIFVLFLGVGEAFAVVVT